MFYLHAEQQRAGRDGWIHHQTQLKVPSGHPSPGGPRCPNRDVFVHQGGLSFPLPRNKVCRWELLSSPAHTGLRGVAGSKEVRVPNGAPPYSICMSHQGNCAAH